MQKIREEEKLIFLLNLKETPELYETFFNKIIGNTLWYSLVKRFGYFDKIAIEGNGTKEVSAYSFRYLNSIVAYILEDKSRIKDVLDLSKEAVKIDNVDIDYEIIDIISKLRCFYNEDFLNEILNLLDRNISSFQWRLRKLDFLFDEFIEKNDDKSTCIFKFILNKHLGNKILNDNFLYTLLNNEKLYKSDNKMICNVIDIFIEEITPILYKYESSFEVENEKYNVSLNNESKTIIISDVHRNDIDNIVYNDRFDIYNFIKKFIESKKSEIDEEETDNTAKKICEDFFTNSESYHSIFEDERHCINDLEYCIAIIKKLLQGLKNNDSIVKYIELLFSDDLSMLNKLALFLVVDKYDVLTPTELEKLIYTDKFEYALRHNIFDDEIKKVFKCMKTTNLHIEKKLDDIINKGPYICYSLYKKENYLNIWRQKRYKALKQFDFFCEKYEQVYKKTKVDYDLVSPIRITQCDFVKELSCISSDEMKAMSVNTLMDKLNDLDISKYKTTEFFEEYSYRGTGETLKNVFIDNPLKYLNSINKFKELKNHVYNVYVVEGIEALLKQRNNGIGEYHQSIVRFLINIYSTYDFKTIEKDKLYEVNENRFYKTIFSPIIFMLNNNFIEKNIVEDIKNFILKISEQIISIPVDKILWGNNDFIFYIINSVQGSYLTMILELSLFLKRNAFLEFDSIWVTEKGIIESLLKNNEIDSNIFLGWSLVNFEYIEDKWIKNKITELEIGSDRWQYFVGGYCYSNYFSEETYILLHESFKKALTFEFRDKNVKQKISEIIALGFLIGYEERFSNTLYKKFIENIEYENVCSFTKIATQAKSMDIFKAVEYTEIQKGYYNFGRMLLEL